MHGVDASGAVVLWREVLRIRVVVLGGEGVDGRAKPGQGEIGAPIAFQWPR